MRVIDPAWIGMKLRKLLNVGEPLGHFMAPVPGERRQQLWPSTVAYIARLVIHRYAMLGVLDEAGFPLNAMGILQTPADKPRNGARRADGRRALPRVRQPDADPQGRLRVLHHLRLHRRVWVRGWDGSGKLFSRTRDGTCPTPPPLRGIDVRMTKGLDDPREVAPGGTTKCARRPMTSGRASPTAPHRPGS